MKDVAIKFDIKGWEKIVMALKHTQSYYQSWQSIVDLNRGRRDVLADKFFRDLIGDIKAIREEIERQCTPCAAIRTSKQDVRRKAERAKRRG